MEPPLIAAEELRQRKLLAAETTASMEPPLVAAEERGALVSKGGGRFASMEPPLIAAEEQVGDRRSRPRSVST